MVQKILFFVLAGLFALFGYFQLNDPTGSMLWLVMYLGIAGICLMAGLGRIYNWLQLGVMAGLLIGIVMLFPSLITFFTNDDGIGFAQTMSNDYPYIEEARECGGLIICLLAMYFVYTQRDKNQG